eukprot:359009-Chlamydomonas_euryale.AAC.11
MGRPPRTAEFMRIPNRTDHPWPSVKGVVSQYDALELEYRRSTGTASAPPHRALRMPLAATAAAPAATATAAVPAAARARPAGVWEPANGGAAAPLGAQIMSSNPQLLGLATRLLLERKGAPRVDLNCGCPANTVTGNGAGSRYVWTAARAWIPPFPPRAPPLSSIQKSSLQTAGVGPAQGHA